LYFLQPHKVARLYVAEMAALGNVAGLFDLYQDTLSLFVELSGSETKDCERGQFLYSDLI